MAKDNNKKESGVSLIITFYMMMIVLIIVLAISIILYSEVKIIRNIGGSVLSFYAADSGIEKVLYYDRQVLPTSSIGGGQGGANVLVPRGLCAMTSSTVGTSNVPNPKACVVTPTNGALDSSVYCNTIGGAPIKDPSSTDCNPTTCKGCKMTFNTTITGGDGKIRNYSVTTSITDDSSSYLFDIKSTGDFNSIGRKIEIYNTSRY